MTAGALILCWPTSDVVTLYWSQDNFIGCKQTFFFFLSICLFCNFVTCNLIKLKWTGRVPEGHLNANWVVEFGLRNYASASFAEGYVGKKKSSRHLQKPARRSWSIRKNHWSNQVRGKLLRDHAGITARQLLSPHSQATKRTLL